MARVVKSAAPKGTKVAAEDGMLLVYQPAAAAAALGMQPGKKLDMLLRKLSAEGRNGIALGYGQPDTLARPTQRVEVINAEGERLIGFFMPPGRADVAAARLQDIIASTGRDDLQVKVGEVQP